MIAIIQYNAGNIRSVDYALRRLGAEPVITSDPELIRQADKVIFPGVGEAGTTMKHLKETGLDRLIVSLKQPVLGICLGMQLMCLYSEEGETSCMGIFEVPVLRFRGELKIPHVGWNRIEDVSGPLFAGLSGDSFVYYVHSFYVPLSKETTAITEYGERFTGALNKGNFYGMQFHPEKSGKTGSKILQNFLDL